MVLHLLACCAALVPTAALRTGLAPSSRKRVNVCMAAPAESSSESPPPADPANEPGRRIFCNRALNMQQIKAVGFDLDYTLAEYIPETFDFLAYDGESRTTNAPFVARPARAAVTALRPTRSGVQAATQPDHSVLSISLQARSVSCSRWAIRKRSLPLSTTRKSTSEAS